MTYHYKKQNAGNYKHFVLADILLQLMLLLQQWDENESVRIRVRTNSL